MTNLSNLLEDYLSTKLFGAKANEVRAKLTKSEALHPIRRHTEHGVYVCPTCEQPLTVYCWMCRREVDIKPDYCLKCGQQLNWYD